MAGVVKNHIWLFFLLWAPILAVGQPVHIEIPLTATDAGGHSSTVYFGVDPAATYCIDPALGEFELPSDRCGTEPLCVYFTDIHTDTGACMGNGLLLDLRAYTSPAQADTYAVAFTAQQFPLVFRWPGNLGSFFDTLHLRDAVNGSLYNANMIAVDSLVVQPGTVLKLLIYARNPRPGVAGVSGGPPELPSAPLLFQNYPNPFNPGTEIRYVLSGRTDVSLRVYDLLGRMVADLVESAQPPGVYTVPWHPDQLPSGMYYYCLRTSGSVRTKSMLFLR